MTIADVNRALAQIGSALQIPAWILLGYKTPLEYFAVESNLNEDESRVRQRDRTLGINYFVTAIEEANFYVQRFADACFISTARSKRDIQTHARLIGGRVVDDASGPREEVLPAGHSSPDIC